MTSYKLGPVEGRKKTNWAPVIRYLKWRKGTPLTLSEDGTKISIAHRKPHTYNAAWGKATVVISCGLCNVEHTVFVWSLAGGGKKCECCKSKINITHTIAYLDKKTPIEILLKIAEPAQQSEEK